MLGIRTVRVREPGSRRESRATRALRAPVITRARNVVASAMSPRARYDGRAISVRRVDYGCVIVFFIVVSAGFGEKSTCSRPMYADQSLLADGLQSRIVSTNSGPV